MSLRFLKLRVLILAFFVGAFAPSVRAQWLTQSFELEAGWNAVFLHVDVSHATIDSLVDGTPIEEIWRWTPPGTVQFVDDPQLPSSSASEWSSWIAGTTNLGLAKLVGDSAYLVKVATNGAPYDWNLKGRPVPPRSKWTVTGLNFIGFPTVPIAPPQLRGLPGRSAGASVH